MVNLLICFLHQNVQNKAFSYSNNGVRQQTLFPIFLAFHETPFPQNILGDCFCFSQNILDQICVFVKEN